MIRSFCNTDIWYDFKLPKCARDCVEKSDYLGSFYEDPACLHDCVEPHCLALLVEDHQTHQGVCAGSEGEVELGWTLSPTSCTMEQFGNGLMTGLCSEETEQALIQTNCINRVWSLSETVRRTIRILIWSMCRREISDNSLPRPVHPCAEPCNTVLTTSGAPVFEDIRCLSDCPVTIIPDTKTITSPNYPEVHHTNHGPKYVQRGGRY